MKVETMNDRLSLFLHDIAAALSSLKRRPLYAALAVGMLALAVGANVAVFAVISRTLLRPLRYHDADRIVAIFSSHLDADRKENAGPVGTVETVQWKQRATLFSGIEVIQSLSQSITGAGEPESVTAGTVSGGLFRLLGVHPIAGRDFAPDDDRPNANVALITYGLWQRRFGGDRKAIGRTLFLDGKPVSVIGILPRDFDQLVIDGDIFVPAGLSMANLGNRQLRDMAAYGRLRDGVSLKQGEAELKRIDLQLEKEFPDSQRAYSVQVKTLRAAFFGDRKAQLLILWIAVLLVQILACVNVANLMFAQISDQRGVTALRLALGAQRWHLIRFRLTESALVSIIGTALGFAFGSVALRLILAWYPDPALTGPAATSAWMLPAFLIVLAALTALLTAIAPAIQESNARLSTVINEGSLRASSSVRGSRWREIFIIAEVALAVLLLLAAAGTVTRFRELQRVDIGFQPDRIMTAQLVMPARYDGRPARAAFARELLRRVEAIPGVTSAAITTNTFLLGQSPGTTFTTDRVTEPVSAGMRRITPKYFELMKTRPVSGRVFTDEDKLASPPVAIVSASLARKFWPGENAVGKRLHRGRPDEPWSTIVGVAPDLHENGASFDLGSVVYVPYLQNNGIYLSLVVRTVGDPPAIRKPMRQALWSLDRNLAFAAETPLREIVDGTMSAERMQASLLLGFAAVAVALAMVGIYGVTSFAVSQRMREVGVRLAFGASPGVIVRELLSRALRSVTIGLAIGIALAILGSRIPVVADYAGVPQLTSVVPLTAALLTSAMLASLLPALRTRRVSPTLLLRDA